VLGFLSALPGIWRLLQCFRRYYDTRAVFPHLVNGGKYGMTIIYYVTLSMYRINQTTGMLALFITFAALNAVYTSIWDLLMDWSLLQPNASKKWLRDVRGYKNPYYYYAAMILDPILRFNWIFYAFFTSDIQHSSICSFLVAFSECTRRGIWVLFRVENEHCSNVRRFKASRDVPLPYNLPSEFGDEDAPCPVSEASVSGTTLPSLSRRRSHTLEAQERTSSRQRPQLRTFTQIVADAHKQDFEKKRKPGAGDSDNINNMQRDGDFDEASGEVSSDDEEVDEEDLLDAEGLMVERQQGGAQDDAHLE